MDLFSNLALGFETAFSFSALLYCFVGVTVGTFIGVLPGIGPLAAILLLFLLTLAILTAHYLGMKHWAFAGRR